MEDYVSPLDGSDISVTFVRDGKKQTISYAPDSEERYIVGISYYETDPKATISSVPEGSAMDQEELLQEMKLWKLTVQRFQQERI